MSSRHGTGGRSASLHANQPPHSAVRRACSSILSSSNLSLHALAALVLGGLATTALPPLHIVPSLVVAFAGLLWLLNRSEAWVGATLVGWAFGLGHFLTSLYWIGHSFFVDVERFDWLAAPAVLLLSALLATFPAIAALLTWLIGGHYLGKVLAFAFAWTAMEWLRGHILTGFPWNLIGYVWATSDVPIQLAAVIGVYGLSFITIIIASLPALALHHKQFSTRQVLPLAMAAALTASLWIGGAIRLATAHVELVPDVRLRLVQPNIPQVEKWEPTRRSEIISRLLDMSQQAGAAGVTHIVWPETALPLFIAEEPELRHVIREIVPDNGLLVTGSLRRTSDVEHKIQYRNSLFAIDRHGEVVATYDKVHLVPFGEYMPFGNLLPFEAITIGSQNFSPGPARVALALPGLPSFSPLICYEIIFPGEVVDIKRRPDWILNITDDAWFGTSAGPYQHFAMAKMRAVEEGVPLVRVANTGITAVVDPYGRVAAQLQLNETGLLDVSLPRALVGPTPYATLRDLPLLALLTAGLFGAIATRRRLRSAES